MKKFIWIIAILTLAFSVYAFGQNQRKQKKFYNLPEVDDEVLVTFRKKQVKPKVTSIKKSRKQKTKAFFDEADAIFGKRRKSSHDKYANQEVSYRKKSAPKKKRSVTHDPEFEDWANRKKVKNKKIKAKN